MGRRKRTIVALKPFCYYCDKEFNNEIILHQHQKARHFNCKACKKRFSTAPALDTHMLQVHKEKLRGVPNAKSGRELFDISIYGMDGVPMELLNIKLAEKVEQKKRKLIRSGKDQGLNLELDEDKKPVFSKVSGSKKLTKTSEEYVFSSNGGFYHNPDSINLTRNSNQISSLYHPFKQTPDMMRMMGIDVCSSGGVYSNSQQDGRQNTPKETNQIKSPELNPHQPLDSSIPLPNAPIPLPETNPLMPKDEKGDLEQKVNKFKKMFDV